MPTAMVTGSPERVPDLASALQSQGFDILPAAALRTLISLLAEAILRDHGPSGVRTTVVDERHAPAAIAALTGPYSPEAWSTYAALEPDLSYSDWRDEVFCLASRLPSAPRGA